MLRLAITSLLRDVAYGLRFVLSACVSLIFLFRLSFLRRELDKIVGQAKITEN